MLIELKRDKTPREIVAQALDYASWVEQLTGDLIARIYRRFAGEGSNLDDAFKNRFGIELDEDALNASHQIILVASELDLSTERILNYLNAKDIAIHALFFQVFQHGDDKLLSRAWFIDPGETQAQRQWGQTNYPCRLNRPKHGRKTLLGIGDCVVLTRVVAFYHTRRARHVQ